jgi:hypothetical protein
MLTHEGKARIPGGADRHLIMAVETQRDDIRRIIRPAKGVVLEVSPLQEASCIDPWIVCLRPPATNGRLPATPEAEGFSPPDVVGDESIPKWLLAPVRAPPLTDCVHRGHRPRGHVRKVSE